MNIEDDESSTLLNYIDNGGEDNVNENNDQGGEDCDELMHGEMLDAMVRYIPSRNSSNSCVVLSNANGLHLTSHNLPPMFLVIPSIFFFIF